MIKNTIGKSSHLLLFTFISISIEVSTSTPLYSMDKHDNHKPHKPEEKTSPTLQELCKDLITRHSFLVPALEEETDHIVKSLKEKNLHDLHLKDYDRLALTEKNNAAITIRDTPWGAAAREGKQFLAELFIGLSKAQVNDSDSCNGTPVYQAVNDEAQRYKKCQELICNHSKAGEQYGAQDKNVFCIFSSPLDKNHSLL